MSATSCEAVRDLLPQVRSGVSGVRDGERVEAHLADCDACRAESEVIGMLLRHPVAAPAGLERRVVEVVARRGRMRAWRPALRHYALAASVAVTLLIGNLVWRARPGPVGTASDGAEDAREPTGLLHAFVPAGDGLLAGVTPMLDDLSVEDLEILLLELDS